MSFFEKKKEVRSDPIQCIFQCEDLIISSDNSYIISQVKITLYGFNRLKNLMEIAKREEELNFKRPLRNPSLTPIKEKPHPNLKIKYVDAIASFGVFATNVIPRHTFLCYDIRENLSKREGEEREKTDGEEMSYIFFYNQFRCIDAVDTIFFNGSVNYGRFLNYSNIGNVNSYSTSNSCHHRILFKSGNNPIEKGDELRYDYGDRRKSVIQANP